MADKLGIGDLAAMGLANVGIGPLKVGNVLDTVEFVKKAWTSVGMPAGFTPTLDLEELDKRITDLKAVEQWLTLNMNMLQGTIQALEIQRTTIATLKAFGAPLEAAAPAAQAIASALGRAASSGDRAGAAGASTAAAPGGDAPAAGATKPAARARAPRRKEETGSTAAAGGFADPGLSPTAWWNLLQNQFNQVAAAALSGVGLSAPEPAAPEPRKAAPAARSGAPRKPKSGKRPAATGRKAAARARKA